jgi:hypothetical protein
MSCGHSQPHGAAAPGASLTTPAAREPADASVRDVVERIVDQPLSHRSPPPQLADRYDCADDVPAPTGESDLDRLSFVAGCWSSFYVDYGRSICWTRTAGTWELTFRSEGPTGPRENRTLRLTRGVDALALRCAGGGCEGVAERPLAELTAAEVVFGSGDARLALRREDRCHISVAEGESGHRIWYPRAGTVIVPPR